MTNSKPGNCPVCKGTMVLVSSGIWYPMHAVVHKNGDGKCKINSGYYEKKHRAAAVWNRLIEQMQERLPL